MSVRYVGRALAAIGYHQTLDFKDRSNGIVTEHREKLLAASVI
jgi:hypothetical protein